MEPWNDPRTTKPFLGDERTIQLDFLRCQRLTLELKCSGLGVSELARRSVEPSTLSLLGLIRHMADVERVWFREIMSGEKDVVHFFSKAEPDGAFEGAVADQAVVAEAWNAWWDEIAFAERFVRDAPDLEMTAKHHGHVSLRYVLARVIAEYARHNGHADLIRERIDGRLGE